MMEAYSSALLGVWVILFTIIAQLVVAAVAHRMQRGYIPGIVDNSLDNKSFIFRSHRAHINSLENFIVMFATILVAMFMGVSATWVAVCVWIYAIARILHMWSYYAIATNRNPSLRSLFYVIGLLANVVLLFKVGFAFLG
ncbi:MAG: MAPEG family protein [Pseudomonadales bacterium]